MRSNDQVNHFKFRRLYYLSFIFLFMAVPLYGVLDTPQESGRQENRSSKQAVVERLEISGDNGVIGRIAQGDQRVRVRAFIRGTDVRSANVKANLRQLTGNPRDSAVRPLPENFHVTGDHAQAEWFIDLDSNIPGGSTVAVMVSTHSGKRSDRRIARAVVYVPPASQGVLLAIAEDGRVKVEVKLKPSTIPDKRMTPLRITAEPASLIATTIADQNLSGNVYIPEGRSYKIIAEDLAGTPVENGQIKDTFTLSLGYPEHISSEEARRMRLFFLSDDRWLPLSSRLDVSRRMVITESARQFGVYRLLAESESEPQGIFVYPNPIQFGEFGGVNRTLKFRNVPPGSVIQIFAVTGEQIREIEAKTAEVSWDGKRGNGEPVTSGLYIYRVEMIGDEAFGRIAILK
jgi:hypothetical protein